MTTLTGTAVKVDARQLARMSIVIVSTRGGA